MIASSVSRDATHEEEPDTIRIMLDWAWLVLVVAVIVLVFALVRRRPR
jgi:hypothetical protein